MIVLLPGGSLIQQQYRTFPAHEELLQRQDLAPVAQRIAGQQPQLRKRIEHHSFRLDTLYLGGDELGGLRQLHLSRMQQCRLRVGGKLLFERRQLNDSNATERPSVRRGYLQQLLCRFGKRHVEHLLAGPYSFEQKLQPKGRLAYPRITFNEIKTVARKPSDQHLIKADYPGSADE